MFILFFTEPQQASFGTNFPTQYTSGCNRKIRKEQPISKNIVHKLAKGA